MGFVGRIFGAVDTRFLIRSYLIGIAFFVPLIYSAFSSGTLIKAIPTLSIFAISTILFPFSKLVWNEIRNLILGDNVFFMNAIVMLFLKFLINALLWGFSIFIAPLGMAYLWFRTRSIAETA